MNAVIAVLVVILQPDLHVHLRISGLHNCAWQGDRLSWRGDGWCGDTVHHGRSHLDDWLLSPLLLRVSLHFDDELHQGVLSVECSSFPCSSISTMLPSAFRHSSCLTPGLLRPAWLVPLTVSAPSIVPLACAPVPFQILTDSLSNIILDPVSCLLYSAFRLTSSQL